MFHCAYIRVTGKRRFKRFLFRVKFPWGEESQPSVLGFYHLVNHWAWTWGKGAGVSPTGLIATTARKSTVVKHHHLFLLLSPIFKRAESQCALHIHWVILYNIRVTLYTYMRVYMHFCYYLPVNNTLKNPQQSSCANMGHIPPDYSNWRLIRMLVLSTWQATPQI